MSFRHFSRGVSLGALIVAVAAPDFLACSDAFAQQALPTINIGGVQRRSASSTPAPRQTGAQSRVVTPAAPGPTPAPVASNLRLEPKTPTEGYIVRNASTATKTDVPIRETPASIQVVPRQVLTDQQVTVLSQAVENASSVRSNNFDGVSALFYIRGFKSDFIFRNALALTQSQSNPILVDTANVERIEVLKGPSSMVFGRSDPGGLINIVTKQPLDQPLYRVEQQIGSYDHYRTEWDVSAPVAQIPGLAYRVSGAYQNNGSFRWFQGGSRAFLAPVIRYSPTAWTEFTAEAELLTSKVQNDLGLPSSSIIGPLLAPIPYNYSFQGPNDPRDTLDRYNVSYNFRQNLTEDWKITNRLLFGESHWSSLQAAGGGLARNFRTMFLSTQFQDLKNYNLSTNIDLNGKFQALGARHDFLFGLDYANYSYDYVYNNGAGSYPINVYRPIFGSITPGDFHDAVVGSGFKFHSSFLARQKGMYVQDHATWFDRLHLMAGVRYDIADVTRGTSESFYDGDPGYITTPSKRLAIADRLLKPTSTFTGWSPRVGVVYDILPELSAYASYSRSFGKLADFDENGVAFPPEKGMQWELGLKAQPLPGILATLAIYQITKSGVTTASFGAVGASQLAGLQRSRGVELDAIGAITDRMSVVANYAYVDAKVIADSRPDNRLNPFGTFSERLVGPESGLLGHHLEFAPRHSGKVFLTYDFGDNGYGFRMGGGVTATTHWWGDIQNTFIMPGFARLDGFASYTLNVEGHKVTAQLNLQNINNVRYFDAVDDTFNFFAPPYNRIPARPFTAVGSLKFAW